MRCMRLILCVVPALFLASATTANAQILSPSRLSVVSPDTTIAALTKRIEALESTVAQLQQKLAFIKSVNPLVLDPGGDITIRGALVTLEAGNNLTIRSSAAASIRSGSTLLIEAGATLDLKGATVRHNGGSVPIACAASVVNGQTISPCSPSVGVPPPQ